MPGHKWARAAVVAAFALGAADAVAAKSFSIPPGTLGEVAAALGVQAGITIAITDPALAARRSPGVSGALSVRAALARAVRGTGGEAIFYDQVIVRIVEKRARRQPDRPRPKPIDGADAPEPVDIYVTATKQVMLADHYPGSVRVVDFQPAWLARHGAQGTAAITETMPTLNSTNLGRGRNKLYVRGIADSSFNGPTQATVGQYLGDVRLNYNAPDPDLNLYDLKRVEILAGPQGSLYGAGSLGGVVRLVPNEPDGETLYATASTGISATRFGGIGADAAAMLNLPIADGRMALRVVVHGAREAGYIDDPSRTLRGINAGRSFGQRLIWRIEDLAGWTVDVGGVFQNISSDDGQYLLRGDPPLVRKNAIGQPFRNDYRLAYVTGRRQLFGSAELVSTTSLVRHDLTSVFDATGGDGTTMPRRFEEKNHILLMSHETRLSGGRGRAPWVAGLSGLYSVSRIMRSLGPLDDERQIVGVRNRQAELSLFGQAAWPISAPLTATAGGRLTIANGAGNLLDQPKGQSEQSSHAQLRVAAMAALDWRVAPSLSTFLHYQQGFRPGGFAVAPAGSTTEGKAFAADDLSQIELGVRWRNRQRDRLSVRAAIFLVDWNQIQADLVDTSGQLNTANIGNGRIYGLDGEMQWRLSSALAVTLSAFLNDSYLYETAPEFPITGHTTLPNIPQNGARIAAEWGRGRFTGNASLRFVGMSNLGVGPLTSLSQGDYLLGGLGGRLQFDRFALSLDITNLTDTRVNTFAFGNPFELNLRDQITPPRPRTFRLGLDARF